MKIEDNVMLIYMCQDGEKPSGVATYGYALLKHFPEAKMLLLNARHPPPAAPIEIHNRIITLQTEVSHNISAVAKAISNLIEASRDHTVLFPNTGDTLWAATLKFLLGAELKVRHRVRVLGIVHSDTETHYRLAKEYATIAPIWIGVSRRCAENLQHLAKRLRIRVYELYYPVELRPGDKVAPTDGLLRLAYAGRLDEPQKRVSRLVALFKELTRRGIQFSATVAGDGPEGNRFSKMLTVAGPAVTESVKVLGALKRCDLDKLWASQDVFLLVSAYEGLPLALLEAMSAGVCPVVMNVNSGLPELLEDGVNARVAKQGDIIAMADAIVELDHNRELLGKLGAAAKRSVSIEGLSPVRHFSKLCEIIKECSQLPLLEKISTPADPTEIAVETICKKVRGTRSPVVIFGAGMFGRKVVDACLKQGTKVTALIDSDPERIQSGYGGIVCLGPERLVECTNALFVVGSMQFDVEIFNRIHGEYNKAGVPLPQVVTFRS